MALPTSGALSLNQIHVEAGGSSGATSSLNDTDIRGLTAASGKTINSTQSCLCLLYSRKVSLHFFFHY